MEGRADLAEHCGLPPKPRPGALAAMTPQPRRSPCLLLALVALALPAAAAPPVNLLLVFVDNVGFGDLGCYGNTAVRTPHLDRLAREGARCTQLDRKSVV